VAGWEPWSPEACQAVIARHRTVEGATLPILHAIQAAFGHIPDAAMPILAQALNLTRAEIYGIVTFYHDFRRNPPGRHVLRLCRAEACQSMGGDEMAEHMKRELAVDWHATTTDGKVTLEPVYCLGLCATAPAAMLDGTPLGRLNADRLCRIVAAVR
jgi:formate dehydrogenase subunit gamma